MQMEMCEMALEPERPRRGRRKLGGFNDYLAILQAILPSCDSYHCHCAVDIDIYIIIPIIIIYNMRK